MADSALMADLEIQAVLTFNARSRSAGDSASMKSDFMQGGSMFGYVQDIETLANENANFRQVVYTAQNCQLVLMSLNLGEEIGAEVHKLDQFFRVESGTGEAILGDVRNQIKAGFAILVPAGLRHNIVNTGTIPLKLYTIYSPPNHRDGVIHLTRELADKDDEHFDGITSEKAA